MGNVVKKYYLGSKDRILIVEKDGVFKVVSQSKFLIFWWRNSDLAFMGMTDVMGQKYIRGDYKTFEDIYYARHFVKLIMDNYRVYTR